MSERPACPEAKRCTHSLYLKGCLSGLRDIIGGKNMNGKVGMRAFSTLLAVMLMSVMMVPVMAAEEV